MALILLLVVAVLPLQDVSISTSGDYERFFERDGVRCHHLLDPKTGRSPTALRSVTILADDGLTSEALSKCVFVMGVARGMRGRRRPQFAHEVRRRLRAARALGRPEVVRLLA